MDEAQQLEDKKARARAKAHAYYLAHKAEYAARNAARMADFELRERERYYKAMYHQEVTKQARKGLTPLTPVRQAWSKRDKEKVKKPRVKNGWSPGEIVAVEPRELSFD
jgi:hypothetical protein